MGVKLPELPKQYTTQAQIEPQQQQEGSQMSTFTQADIEAAEKKGFEAGATEAKKEVQKHLAFIGTGSDKEIIANIESNKNYADCFEAYTTKKIETEYAAKFKADNAPTDDTGNHDASTEVTAEAKAANDKAEEARAIRDMGFKI